MSSRPSSVISFVIPCLNEQETLPYVLEKINTLCQTVLKNRATEVIVADNGSTDNSVTIALEHGAKVVHCQEKGYGAALQCGIQNATGEVIVFADADNTYDLLETPKLLEELEKGYDLVLGSRIKGDIHPGAMPRIHRYLGTPVLNFFINLLYSRNGVRITDCNSGFRCFKRDMFLSWGINSTGMEFASEMLVKALKANAKISQVPISFYPDPRHRTPHLKTWRDGMRHLLQIFLYSPEFFYYSGITSVCMSWLVLLIGLFFGPISFGFASIFGIHTMMFALLGSCFGVTIWGIGLTLAAKIDTNVRAYEYLIDLSEDRLFWCALLFALISFTTFLAIFVSWGRQGFEFLSLEKETLVLTAFGTDGLFLVSSVITAHLVKGT